MLKISRNIYVVSFLVAGVIGSPMRVQPFVSAHETVATVAIRGQQRATEAPSATTKATPTKLATSDATDKPASTSPVSAVTTQPVSTTEPLAPTPTSTGVEPSTVFKVGRLDGAGTYAGSSFSGTQTLRLSAGQSATFRNCRFDAASGPYALRCDGNRGSITLDHCEFFGASSALIYGDGFVIANSYLHQCGGDGLKPGQHCQIMGNYVHDLGRATGAHADGVQIRGGSDIRIVGNHFDQAEDQRCNSNLFVQTASSHDIIFANNWCSGGNFAICVGDSTMPATIQISCDIFAHGTQRYGCLRVMTGAIVAGNHDDLGAPVQ